MKINSFDFPVGKSLGKYEIVQRIGEGFEGEVYIIKEVDTDIERVAKFFFPHRNEKNSTSNHYAKQLHKLNNCHVVVQYHFRGEVQVKGQRVTYLVSEFIDGEVLEDYVQAQVGKRLQPFEALHLFYAIVNGLYCVHKAGEYHGDIHNDNIMVKKKGLGFEIRLIDLFNFGASNKSSLRKDDIVDLVRVLYDSVGGAKHYAKQPEQIKAICCGLKRNLILKKFPTLQKLKDHLETIDW